MAKEDFRFGMEWNDTPTGEVDPLVCSDVRYERDGLATFGLRAPLDDSWGELRPASEMPSWAERDKWFDTETPTKERSNVSE